ncbi:MAG: Segregation and condensation protein B [Candidatus Nomurabacteria bacterium GW2011_GWA1_37_20]|uniref:Segregation and condensation protein B n=2 Tax=Parcubacteria group TaxID=1794811 RepID=A0A0G0KCF3_9BACT|nr:MAG: Segregation and condensation protein B [Parcubacteria group bacterium GW2011_GWC1_36_9]KKQ28420.1 MAG: Segregation and condensation protein B [Parcubacteria group bacterium GW2011_GWB1_37_13]KKQ32293.1 MAG: Segregation and condensation protein B [Candidatus Nomurabacteria bacterium GW2011_GWA1_37_20]KKQ46799.1 MAG: Segregation and condensation protein B [Candidatus Yanofskybacteria bacterium GW2011_GWC2_37_9]
MDLEKKIEALLFWKGEPLKRKKLAEIFNVKNEEISEALEKLKKVHQERGVVFLEKDDEVILGTAPELSDFFEKLQKEELNKDLSKASLETLSIILYKNGVSKADIDYIRGVNSGFTLRALSVRGLIERITDQKDNRRYIYKPSFELLSFMGIKSVEELPDYREVSDSLTAGIKNGEDLSADAEVEVERGEIKNENENAS